MERIRQVLRDRGVTRRGLVLTTGAGIVGVGAIALGWLAGKEGYAVLDDCALKGGKNSTIGKDLSPNDTRRIMYKG